MPTIESYQDVILYSRLGLNLQEASLKPCDEVGGVVVVYEDSDAQWVQSQDLGSFNTVRASLMRYGRTEGSVGHPGCILLGDACRALPTMPLTDASCPTMSIIAGLRRRGWQPVKGRVVHVGAEVGDMDGRYAVHKKHYYRVLYQIEQCAPLTTNIPSDEPLMFYKLLLLGRNVEPGLGDASFRAILRDADISDDDIENVAVADDDIEIVVAGRDMPLPLPAPVVPAPIVPRPPAPVVVGGPGSSHDAGDIAIGGLVPRPKAARRQARRRPYLDAIGGGECYFEEYTTPTGSSYGNWIFKCPHVGPGHSSNCERTLGMSARNTARHGSVEPLAFLHAWRDVEPDPVRGHRKTNPDPAVVDAFISNHSEELTTLNEMFGVQG